MMNIMNALQTWFLGLATRERRFVSVGAVAGVLILVFGVLFPLDHSVTRAHLRLTRKQADLAWMRNVAPQLASAVPLNTPTNQRSLIVIVDSSAHEAGLGSALTSSEPSGPGGLRVRLDKASFDMLVGWLARLAEQNGIRVESATVDAAGGPGIVSASLVLRGRP
jgi:type II secretory pathway component PulM